LLELYTIARWKFVECCQVGQYFKR